MFVKVRHVPILRATFRFSKPTMVLGKKALVVLAVVMSIGIGVVVLPAIPQTAPAFNCIVVTHACLEARDPIEFMKIMFPDMGRR